MNFCAGKSSLWNLEVLADEAFASSASHIGTDDLNLFHFKDVHTHAETLKLEGKIICRCDARDVFIWHGICLEFLGGVCPAETFQAT